MGTLGKKEKKIFKELSRKSAEYLSEMNKETEELHEELQDAYAENRFAVQELIALAEAIRGKISGEEWQKLEELSKKIIQLKKFAKKSISAVAELSRSQRKATREAMRDFNELAEL